MIKRFAQTTLIFVFAGLVLSGCGAQQASGTKEEMSAGERVFKSKCNSCHKIDRIGGKTGPDLSRVGTRRDAAWIDQVLQDPTSTTDTMRMKKPTITDEQRADVIDYLATLK